MDHKDPSATISAVGDAALTRHDLAMRDADKRYGRWLDITSDLLRTPLTAFPYTLILRQLIDAFEAEGGSWARRDADGRDEVLLWPAEMRPDPVELDWMSARLDQHPLIRWFAMTGDPTAQTIGRVPPALVDSRYAAWHDILGRLGSTQQMSMPLFWQRGAGRTFILIRSECDFPDHDVRLARRLQPLLAGVERQAAALSRWRAHVETTDHAAESVAETGLTGRELAVLHLLADGLTAAAIGRRLNIAPRTVTKHLEHVYAKLRTHDRLSAVLRAQRLGLLPPP